MKMIVSEEQSKVEDLTKKAEDQYYGKSNALDSSIGAYLSVQLHKALHS
jgi:hypothetical protein